MSQSTQTSLADLEKKYKKTMRNADRALKRNDFEDYNAQMFDAYLLIDEIKRVAN